MPVVVSCIFLSFPPLYMIIFICSNTLREGGYFWILDDMVVANLFKHVNLFPGHCITNHSECCLTLEGSHQYALGI